WSAQDLGMMSCGLTAQSSADRTLAAHSQSIASMILRELRGPRDLFCDALSGPRRLFASFASQVYSVLALYRYGLATGDAACVAAASACVARLISLQGPQGEWPW